MGVEEVMKFMLEKLKLALVAVENFGGEVLAWFDKVFPAETRSVKIHHWLHIALPFVVVAVVLLVSFWLCRCFCRCCCGGARGGGRMMRAPGRPSMRISRNGFGADPKGYFLDLRGQPDARWEQLC